MPKRVNQTNKTAAEMAAMDVFEKNEYDLFTAYRKAKSWYEQQMVLLMKQVQAPMIILKGAPQQLTVKLMPGKMYMFVYDPIDKQSLKYFDRFPCLLLYKRNISGFSGLNFHYLPYQMRVLLLYRLLQYKTNAKFDENTRIKYTWKAIKGVSKFAAAVPAFHQYNFAGLRSPFREIRAYDWTTAVLLPVEQFVKLSDDQIWDVSRQHALRIM